MSVFHVPVLAAEIAALAPNVQRVVDGTLGDGGHAELFLERGASVLGIDRDPNAIARARHRLPSANLTTIQGNVFDPPVLDAIVAYRPDLILLDLGVSSAQIDDPDRGFTFRPGAVLDMRMSQRGPTAADLLNEASERELAEWFRNLADEPRGVRLARVIIRRRANQPMRTSDDLVNAIREVLGPTSGPGDFARLFQAVRIAVNDEVAMLESGLPALRDALVLGGVLAVISYHSGEDRVVKHAFREWGRSCICPPELPVCQCRGRPLGTVVRSRAIVPTEAETSSNPRARSAKLRAFIASPPPLGKGG